MYMGELLKDNKEFDNRLLFSLFLRKIINGMKYLLAFDLFLLLCLHSAWAQHVEQHEKQDSVRDRLPKDGEIELSDAFNKVLDGVFLF